MSETVQMEEEIETIAITSTEVLGRVNALIALQDKQNELTEQMEKEILEIEKKYLLKFQPLAEKRSEIVTGKVEPTQEEMKCKEPFEIEGLSSVPTDKGIPKFWLNVLQHTEVSNLIEEVDEEPLAHLVDIKIVQVGEESDYSLEFHFSENPFFTDKIITKTVTHKEGDLDNVVSSPVHWKDGKNFTVKTVKKTVKSKPTKGKAANSTVTNVQEVVPCFFSMFLSPAEEKDAEEEDNETLYIQYQILTKLKDIIVPNAVEFFLGRATDEEDGEGDYGDFDGYGDEDDDEEFDDEEDDDDEVVQKPKGGKGAKPQQPQDCKQQ